MGFRFQGLGFRAQRGYVGVSTRVRDYGVV